MVERLIDWGLFAALADADADARAGRRRSRWTSSTTKRARWPPLAPGSPTPPGPGAGPSPRRRRVTRPSAAGIRLSGDGVVLDVHLHEASVYDFLVGRPGGRQRPGPRPRLPRPLRPAGRAAARPRTAATRRSRLVHDHLRRRHDPRARAGGVRRPPDRIDLPRIDGRAGHAGRRSGDARAGRHLFGVLSELGAEVVDMGSSDWVVFPRAGAYPGDEAYFLRCILSQIGHGGGRRRSDHLRGARRLAAAARRAGRAGASSSTSPTRSTCWAAGRRHPRPGGSREGS